MEELRELKQLFEDGFIIESEYNRRRVQLINQITGKNYTLEDILRAEGRQVESTPAPAPAPVQQPVPIQTPIQQNVVTRKPAVIPQEDSTFANRMYSAPTTFQEKGRIDGDISSLNVVLEEIPAEELEIWDELDALSLQGGTQDFPTQTQETLRQGRQLPVASLPTNTLQPPQNFNAQTTPIGGTLRAAPSIKQQPVPGGGGLQPTSNYPASAAGGTLRQPVALQPASNYDSNPMGTLRQPAVLQQPTSNYPQQNQMGTLRQPAALQPTANYDANQMGTLRQPAAGLQPTANYNQNQMGTLRQPAALQPTANYDANQMGTLRQPAAGLQPTANYNQNQMGTLRQPAGGLQPTANYNQNQMGTLRQPAFQNQADVMTMRGQNMNMYGQVDMYGNPVDMNMYGQVDMYGNPVGMDMYNSAGGYGNQPMGVVIGNQPIGGINMGNTMYGQQAAPQMHPQMVPRSNLPLNAAPSEFRNTPSLESHSMTAKPSSKKMLETLNSKKDSKEPYTWEFFHAASNNNVKRLNELIELGVFVNQTDVDTGNTALHMAAQKGQKHALFFLVDQGADIDAQNKKGSTPLHMLVTHRFNTLAVWLVKQGGDITIEDVRGFTPYDLALSWLQKEMKEAVYGRQRTQKTQQQINRTFGELSEELHPELRQELQKEVNFNKMQDLGINMDTIRDVNNQKAAAPQARGGTMRNDFSAMESIAAAPPVSQVPQQASAPVEQEVMKIYLKNNSYKSLLITSETKAGDVCAMMANKLNMEEHVNSFDLVDVQRDNERRLDPAANIFKIKKFWPLILGKNGNETEKHCYFMVVPKRGTSEAVQRQYRKAIS